jgi:hypothetical protein
VDAVESYSDVEFSFAKKKKIRESYLVFLVYSSTHV